MQALAERNALRAVPGETSLAELALMLLRFYRRFGRLLMLPALLASLGAAWWTAQHPVYRASAVMDVPGLSLEEWRQVLPLLWDPRWVAASMPGDTPAAAAFQRQALNPAFWDERVQFRTALRRDDLRNTPNADVKNTRTLGLEMTLPVVDERQAQRRFDSLAGHIRQALLWNELSGFVRERQAELASNRPALQVKIIKARFGIEQNRQRMASMQALLQRYPELRSMNASSVTTVQEGGASYLAPLTQIVALEAANANAEAEERQDRRELERLDWYAKLLGEVDAVIRDSTSGTQLADYLRTQQSSVLGGAQEIPDVARQVADEINQKLEGASFRERTSLFKSSVAIAQRPIAARNPLLVGLGVFALVLGGLSLLLAGKLALRRSDARLQAPLFPWLPAPLRRWLLTADGQ